MKLNKIEIKNFKSFSMQAIEFKGLTLLSGLNSSGKSTVINSILLPLQIDSNNKLFLNGTFFNLSNFKSIFHQWALDDKFGVKYFFDESSEEIYANINNVNEERDFIKLERSGEFTKYKSKIKYISAERISPKHYFIGNTADENDEFLGVHGEYSISVLSTFKNDTIPILKMKHENSGNYNAPSSSLLANVNAWLDKISPNITINADIQKKIRLSTLDFGYENETTMSSVGSLNVGFGLTYVLPILIAGLLSVENDILIVENPEAHLHPAGQRHMGDFLSRLAANGVQVVIETHSDHVVNGIRIAIKDKVLKSDEARFYYFSKLESVIDSSKIITSSVSVVEVSDKGKITKAPEGFFDEWEEALYKLL
jgi:predicted ATPase